MPYVGASLVAVNDPLFLNMLKTKANREQADIILVENSGFVAHDIYELKDADIVTLQRACELSEMQNVFFYTNCKVNATRLNNQGIRSEVLK